MRTIRIFLLHFQEVFEKRGQSFVWLLVSFIAPLLMILFWRGAKSIPGWSQSDLASYYFLVIIVSSFVMTHIEERVGTDDIMDGQLATFIVKPYSYFWLKFYYALTHRLLQGFFGIVIFFFFSVITHNLIHITSHPVLFLLGLMSLIGGFFVAFIFKMIVGFLSFWMTEAKGFYDIVNIFVAIFAGFLMPISLFPPLIEQISYYLPFVSMVYLPVLIFDGKVSIAQAISGLGVQCLWIGIFIVLYKLTWNFGIKKFTSVGQ